MNRSQLAQEYFLNGYNCSQSVVKAYQDLLGDDSETLIKTASSFGGGMGRLREVCGAVSGLNILIGYLYGYSDNDTTEKKKELYEKVQKLLLQFEEENGTLYCRELLNLKQKHSLPTPSERNKDFYQTRPCQKLIGQAAKILEDYMESSI